MTIAVLALQGAFIEHERMLESLGCRTFEVRKLSDWYQEKDGVILPGGESTAMLRLLNDEGLLEPIRRDIENGLPVMGTCAGMILLAKSVVNDERERISTMDITVRRNAYGRQLGSFNTVGAVEGIADDIPMTFIRAPYIEKMGEGVKPLATVDGQIVAASQGKQLAVAFHPELTDDMRLHEAFLRMC